MADKTTMISPITTKPAEPSSDFRLLLLLLLLPMRQSPDPAVDDRPARGALFGSVAPAGRPRRREPNGKTKQTPRPFSAAGIQRAGLQAPNEDNMRKAAGTPTKRRRPARGAMLKSSPPSPRRGRNAQPNSKRRAAGRRTSAAARPQRAKS